MEVVDHEQFFKDLDDEETGGFDCIARYLGKGIIQPALDATLEEAQLKWAKEHAPPPVDLDGPDAPKLPKKPCKNFQTRVALASGTYPGGPNEKK